MADEIRNLPRTASGPTHLDVQVMRSLLDESIVIYELKRLIVPALAFFALNLHVVDEALRKLTGQTEGVHLLIKTVIFIVILIVGQLLGIA